MILKRIVHTIIISCAAFVVVVLPHTAQAALPISRSYDGCFEREGTDVSATVWMRAPQCTITLTNDYSAAVANAITVINLDANRYQVTDASGTPITAGHNNNTLTFSITLLPSTSTIVTISPWDYDPSTSDFWFAAVSDTQSQSGGSLPNPIFETIQAQLQQIHPPFIVHSGDVIKGHSGDPEEHEFEYELYDELFRTWETSTFAVPGNHDAKQDLSTYYSAFWGNPNNTFVYGNTRFIGLNTAETPATLGTVTETSWTWLTSTLSNATEDHIVVFTHYPIVPPEWSPSVTMTSNQRLPLAQLLVDYGVELVLVGHAHGYDDNTIDSTDLTGLNGSFRQLIIGGSGGEMTNYEGDYFFMLFHVTSSGIEPIRMEYSTTDISTEYESINDGSATEMTLHAYNNSVVPVPFMRASVQLNASEKAYASTAAGDFFPFTSAVIDGVLHSYVELSLGTYETQDMIVKERTRMLTNVANQVDNTGHITFSELPTAASTETDLSAVSETTATIQMHAWDGSQDMRTWTETTSANSSTTYSITNLYPERQYTVWVKGKVVDRIATTAQGVTQFSYKSPAKVRKFRLTIVKKRIAKQAAFLPAQEGGSHVRVYNDSRALQAFMAYDKTIIGGFESHWGDIDGDQKMELLVVPINGTRAPLKIFDDTGEELASIFPFGEQFEGGIVVVTGDIDNDEKEEIIVGPQSDYRSTMHVYTYNGELQQIEKIQTLQAFKDTQYTDGLMLQAGDINGKRGMEIIIAPRSTKQIIRVYRWSPSQQKLRSWKKYRPFTIDDQNATAGFSIATGDVNFDGKEEIVLGSLSGDSRIQVIAYKSKKQRLKQISSIYAFGKQFSGGVSLEVGNIRKNAKDEIVVVGKTNATLQNKIKVYSINAKNRLIHVSSVRPFGNIVDGGIALSLIDIDGDDKKELVTARSRGASDVHIFEPRGGKKMRELANFTVYDNSYESGLTISK